MKKIFLSNQKKKKNLTILLSLKNFTGIILPTFFRKNTQFLINICFKQIEKMSNNFLVLNKTIK